MGERILEETATTVALFSSIDIGEPFYRNDGESTVPHFKVSATQAWHEYSKSLVTYSDNEPVLSENVKIHVRYEVN